MSNQPEPTTVPQPPAWPRSDWRRLAGGAAIIVLAVFAVYWPALAGQFLWDDVLVVHRNPLVTGELSPRAIWFHMDFPLTYVAFWLEWLAWGNHPAGYHVVNVLLHAASALLLWRVLAWLKIPAAWLAAMIFAVHPLCVGSVAWISELKNTLSLPFFLLSLLLYLQSDSTLRTSDFGLRISTSYCLSLLAFALALLAKTSTVMLPMVLVACAWWQRGRITWRDWMRASPFFVIALGFGLMSIWFQAHGAISGATVQSERFWGRLAGAGMALWFYLGKALLPLNLCMIYPHWKINAAAPGSYRPLLLWCGVLAACWQSRRTWGRHVLFGLGCFTVTLFPALGFFDMYFLMLSRVSDHFVYLPLTALAVLMAGGLGGLTRIAAAPTPVLPPYPQSPTDVFFSFRGRLSRDDFVLKCFLPSIVLSLSAGLLREIAVPIVVIWLFPQLAMVVKRLHDRGLSGAWVFICPLLTGLIVMIMVIINAGSLGAIIGAIPGLWLFVQSVFLQGNAEPNKFGLPKRRVAKDLEKVKRAPEQKSADTSTARAPASCRLTPPESPGSATGRRSGLSACRVGWEISGPKGWALGFVCGGFVAGLAGLAMLHAQVFESEEALWRDTLARNPAAWLAHANLGWILAKQQNYDEAKAHLVASLELNPNNAQAHSNLGRLLSLQGKPAEAEVQFQAALKIKSKDAEIRRAYASALAEQGSQAEAVAQLREALRLHPDTETRLQLATLFVQSGKPREAVAEYCEVLVSKPDQPEALNNVAWLLATSPDATVRNGAEAVRLAEHACRLSGNAQPRELGALAAAYAEAGRFPEAVETAQKAVNAARAGGNDQLAAMGEQLLNLFRAGKPYHEPAATAARPGIE